MAQLNCFPTAKNKTYMFYVKKKEKKKEGKSKKGIIESLPMTVFLNLCYCRKNKE